ncbi:hypothetical protein SLS57_002131 [Botryosphaeria dothidea]
MASLNPDSFMSSWLRLVDDPSKDVLSKITTTYTNAPKGNQTSSRSATSSADSDGDQKMTDSEDESDEADFDEDEEDGSDMEEGQSLGAEEPAGKVGNCESDGVT